MTQSRLTRRRLLRDCCRMNAEAQFNQLLLCDTNWTIKGQWGRYVLECKWADERSTVNWAREYSVHDTFMHSLLSSPCLSLSLLGARAGMSIWARSSSILMLWSSVWMPTMAPEAGHCELWFCGSLRLSLSLSLSLDTSRTAGLHKTSTSRIKIWEKTVQQQKRSKAKK